MCSDLIISLCFLDKQDVILFTLLLYLITTNVVNSKRTNIAENNTSVEGPSDSKRRRFFIKERRNSFILQIEVACNNSIRRTTV